MWRHIEWEPDRPDTAAFRCPHCETLIDESHKPAMVEAGTWRATHPEVTGHHGYRLNSLVSLLPNVSWAALAREFLQAKDDRDRLMSFVTTKLAEPWREQADETNEGELAARAEPFSLDAIPDEVLVLTVGCDVQNDSLEVSTVGWGREGTAFVLDHHSIFGSPDENEPWIELDDWLKRRWSHPKGGTLKIDATCIDAGSGSHFDVVCKFAAARLNRRVLAIKGASGFGRPAIMRSRSRTRVLHIVGVDSTKSGIIAKLAKGRAIRFSDTLEPIWFEQVCSERRVVRMSRGKPIVRLEQIPGRENHALDALVYATAARAALRLDLDQRSDELRAVTPPSTRSGIIRSRFMEGGRL